MSDHVALVPRSDGVEHGDVECGEPARVEPEFETAPPLGFGCARPGSPSTVHPDVAVHGNVVEAQQQMSADGVGSSQPLPGQIEVGDTRMTSGATLHSFADEPLGDPIG
jgi:hypothetical protein